MTTTASLAQPASFDCNRASTSVEKMICTDDELRALDSRLSAEYKRRLSLGSPPTATLVSEQRGWLLNRDACSNPGCVRVRYIDRISELTERGRSLQEIAPKLRTPDYARRSNAKVCGRLLDSLKRWQGVTVVFPLVTADSVDDRRFRQQIGTCDPKEFVEHYAIESRVIQANNLPDQLSREEERDYGTGYEMLGGFRLYEVNIDNDARNGDELVMYGAGVRLIDGESNDRSVGFSNFNVIDTRQCIVSSSAQVSDVLNKPDTFVGILRFDEGHYVFDAKHYPSETLWGLTLQRPAVAGAYFEDVCSFVSDDD